jgi:hemin uptake protein HemP
MESSSTPPPPDRAHAPAGPRREEIAIIDSERLFDGRTEIRVRHRGEEYRLRITRQGKLILTK